MYIIHIRKLSLVQTLECAPQHVYAQTQISSVLGLTVLSLWGFPAWTPVYENDTKSLVIDRLSSADPQSRVLGAMGCEIIGQKGEGGVSLWAMTEGKPARCVVLGAFL